MHNTIRFILAGQVKEISDVDPSRTVLEYLREDCHLTGTKEGCAEGDCGACTVVIGELQGDEIRYLAVNSCIQFLASLDGKQLLTVEDLHPKDVRTTMELHPVQQAMVEQHGSQCGFCTPGFVMSLFAMYHNDPERDVNRSEIELGLAGNLCRCTGYAPIMRAAEQALRANRKDNFSGLKKQSIELLESIQTKESLQVVSENGRFFAPQSVAELCDLLQGHPQAVLVAGATDVGLWVTKQHRKLDTVIYLGGIDELKQITDTGNHLLIGATATYTDAIGAVCKHYPAFRPLIERIGATQVRNVGTIGGNIANGSPIGDMPPGLIATGARLALRNKQGQRLIELEDYFISYGKQDLHADEFVEQIILPAPSGNQLFSTYKVSKRLEQDISAVCGAFSMQIEKGKIANARVCFGGMAETPKRATACEQVLNGNAWHQQTITDAMKAMLEDFSPITDMRATAGYRMRVAQNLLQRFFLEHADKTYPVRLGVRYGGGFQDGESADA